MLTKKDSTKETKVKLSKVNALNKNAEENSYCCSQSSLSIPSPSKPIKPNNSIPSKNQDAQEKKSSYKTRLTIKYDIGYQNKFFIRGKGANLSWDKGQEFTNVKPDEWIWETEIPFNQCEFKVLINDEIYEIGENHFLNCGSSVVYTPHFN
ncbi:MAG: hypothetical protein Q8K60_07910 [Parachlamydiaceae bacterium]|nr:hypothetical protein [Parachlamydiaceae bacterium]